MARPNIWLYLLRHPEFLDLLIKNKKQIVSLISTDWEPFFPTALLKAENIHVNNCMVDWQTGLNFHTCVFGAQHFLPIFVRNNSSYINWLNLDNKNIYNTNDTISIKSLKPIRCKCGFHKLDIEICCRSHHLIDLTLSEILNSRYKNLQIVKDGASIHIFYSTDGIMSSLDVDILNERFNKPLYHRDHIAITGVGKWPGFWDRSLGPYRVIPFMW